MRAIVVVRAQDEERRSKGRRVVVAAIALTHSQLGSTVAIAATANSTIPSFAADARGTNFVSH